MREMLRRNLGYKIVSLALAILFWLYVSSLQGTTQVLNGDQTFTVSLVIKNQPTNMIVMSKLPSVQVRLQGSNSSFNVNDLFAYVDLTSATTGEKNYTIAMDPPPGIKVLNLQPQQISLNTDMVEEKVLPVQLNLSGTPAPDFIAGNPVLKPASVNVRGPSTILTNLDKVIVEASIAGATDSVQISSPVLFRDQEGKPIYGPQPDMDILSASPGSVDVIVPIQPKGLDSKMVPLKVTTKGEAGQGYVLHSVTAIPDSMLVHGKPEDLKGLDTINIGPVDITGLTGNKTYQIGTDRINLPKGVSFSGNTMITVIAEIGAGPIEKTLDNIPVQVKNIPAGLKLQQPVPPVSVMFRGLPDDLNTLKNSDIQLWIDATNLTAGTYNDVKIYWQLPPGIDMISISKTNFILKGPELQDGQTQTGQTGQSNQTNQINSGI